MTSSSEQSERPPVSLPDSVGVRFGEILSDELSSRGMIPIQCASLHAAIYSAMSRVREETIRESRLRLEEGWQPIETAPKGVDLIGLFADGTVRSMWYFAPSSNTFGWCAVGCRPHKAKPTHWMPLPTPPSDLDRGDDSSRSGRLGQKEDQ